MNRAKIRARWNDVDGALADVDKAISISAQDPTVYITKSEILSRNEDHLNQALKEVSHAVKLAIAVEHPVTYSAVIMKSQIERSLKMIQESLKTLKTAESFDPLNPLLYQEITRSNLMMDAIPQSALDTISYALSLDPSNIESYILKARLEVVMGLVPTAIKTLTLVAKLDPTSSDIIRFRGILKYETSDYAGALTDFQEAADLADHPDATSSHNMGLCYLKLGQLTEALNMFTKALDTDPGLCASWFHLAAIQISSCDYLGALDSLSRSEVDSEESAIAKGQCMFALGRCEEALACMRFRESGQDCDCGRIIVADSLFHLGRIEEACHIFEQSLKFSEYTTFMVGKCHAHLGNKDKAIEIFGTCSGPFQAPALQERSELNYSLHRYEDALADMEVLSSLVVIGGSDLIIRGLCSFQLHQFEKALVDWTGADEQSVVIQSLMAECMIQIGSHNAAIETIDTIIPSIQDNRDLFLRNYINRAKILIIREDYELAIADIEACLRGAPRETSRQQLLQLYESRYLANKRLGRYREAASDYETASELRT